MSGFSSKDDLSSNLQIDHWSRPLEDALRLGYADEELLDYLDDILMWYSNTELYGKGDLFIRLSKEYGERDFRVRFEDFVDRLAISNIGVNAQALFGQRNPNKAKWRYRKLISLFHPDKGSNTQDWLNFRAEKINKLFTEYTQSFGRDRRTSTHSFSEGYSTNERRKRRVRKSTQVRGNNKISRKRSLFYDWRRFFADPERLEKRILVVCLVVLFVFGCLLIVSANI